MACRCVVKVCPNSYLKTRTKGPDLRFHLFPKNQNVRDKWIEACQHEASWSAGPLYVCSKHFLPSDYERDLKAELMDLPPKKILKPDAIPSLLLTTEQMREFEISQRAEKFEECLRQYNKVSSESNESLFDLILPRFGIPKIFVSLSPEKLNEEDQFEGSPLLSESINHELDENVFSLSELCRLCGSPSNNLKSIIGNDDLDYYALIQEYIPTIEIDENDSLSHVMCSRCENSLISWHQFLTMCDTTNRKFELIRNSVSLINQTKNENDIPLIQVSSQEELENINHDKEKYLPHLVEVIKDEFVASDSDTTSIFPNDFSYANEPIKPARKRKRKVFKTRVDCEICHKSFRCSYTKKIHVRTVHTDERPFFCSACKASFKRKDHLQCHVAMVHDRRPSQRNAKRGGSVTYLCAECGKVFGSKTSYREHNDSVHGDVQKYHCDQCNLSFSRYSKLYHHKVVLNHAKNDFLKACAYCGLEFQSEIYYVRHMTKHEEVSHCEKCDSAFGTHREYKEHVSKVHAANGEYACDACSRKFTSKTSLFHHKKAHENNEKPFQCEYCNWRFRNRGHLSVHLYRHTGERPYVCSICNKGFKQKGDMRKHKAGHLLHEKKSSTREADGTAVDCTS